MWKSFFVVVLATVVSSQPVVGAGDVILSPVKSGKQEVVLIIVQAPGTTPSQYTPLALSLQNTSFYSLWIGIPEYTFDTALSFDIDIGVDRVLTAMKSQGMNATSLFFAAHSSISSGPTLQKYLLTNKDVAIGQILMGGFLQRKYRDTTYPIPTLMVSGELDGVCRVTRIMEEYYHRIYLHRSDIDSVVAKYPIAVVRGMTHFQFASGNIPEQIKELDFEPEISNAEAHQTVASIITAFISATLGNTSSTSVLTNVVNITGKYLQPLIDAYTLEGSYYFKPPCNDNPPSSTCQLGCRWTETAMEIMAELPTSHVNDTDGFHPAAEIFPAIHHPKILSNCSSPESSCMIQLTSVSENIYKSDKDDDGLVSNSASEIRAKLKSRQSVLLAAGHSNVDFNVSDAGSRCKTINQRAYDWALNHTDPTTLARFRKHGVPMIMGEDKGCLENGGLWIYLPMHYSKASNSTGGEVLIIQSIQMKTTVKYPIGIFAGMHYCKLLTPARAMEWIYVDSLRTYYTVKDKQK